MRVSTLALALVLPLAAACAGTSDKPGVTNLDATNGLDVLGQVEDTVSVDPTEDVAVTAPPDDDVTMPPHDTATTLDDAAVAPPTDTASAADTGHTGDTGDTGTTGGAPIGAACTVAADCAGADPVCLGPPTFPGGYCALAGCSNQDNPCPDGASCWSFGASNPTLCIQDCASDAECRTAEGYECDADDTCWPTGGGTVTTGAPVGGPCASDSDCADADAFCYPPVVGGQATGFYQGYCMIADCTAGSCPTGARCEAIFVGGGTACVASCTASSQCGAGYACFSPGMCWPSCASTGCAAGFACDAAEDICVAACQDVGCPTGSHCWPDGTCGPPPCTPTSCGAGYVCAASGLCAPDLGAGPGPGPGPTCASVTSKTCDLGASGCASLLQFEPVNGPGYTNYPLNGETWANQYRSYAREDVQRLIKWATGMVDCKAASWSGGNGAPLGLGDMSEADGAIPGTSVGQPGHPPGTHLNGVDMDIAYYQVTSANNHLRAVCPHTINGQDAYRCVGPPNNLDIWRTAYFIGLLVSSPKTRVIGVDGQIGPLVEQAMATLCQSGWLEATKRPCTTGWNGLAYETEQTGAGWYNFHHHHLHISTHTNVAAAPTLPGAIECKIPGCPSVEPHESFGCGGHGEAAPRLLAPAGITRSKAPASP